jgi:uncharacterized protein YegL
MENCLREILKACQRSPHKDSLLIRLVTFEDSHKEVHGFKLLAECNPDDYNGLLIPGGMTALYDATVDSVEATYKFGDDLIKNDYDVNGLVVVVTDGMNNRGKCSVNDVQKAFKEAVSGEHLESLMSILVGIVDKNDPSTSSSYSQVSQYLTDFKDQAGFQQYVELTDAKDTTIAKLAQFISKSISSQSQARKSGGPSQSVAW